MSLILGVVDDESTRQVLQNAADSLGYPLVLTDSSSPAFPIQAIDSISLVVFDVDDEHSIYSVCHQFRPSCKIPVIVLINEGSEERIPEFMSAGAADCVVKPLRSGELSARMIVSIRGKNTHEKTELPVFRCKHLMVNPKDRKVFREGKEIRVSPMGFKLLVYFMQHKNEVINKERLIREVWGHLGGFDDANLVDSAIRRLRKDIGDDANDPQCLHTVRGVGYRLEDR